MRIDDGVDETIPRAEQRQGERSRLSRSQAAQYEAVLHGCRRSYPSPTTPTLLVARQKLDFTVDFGALSRNMRVIILEP